MIKPGQVFIFQSGRTPEIMIVISEEKQYYSCKGHALYNLTLQKFEWDETSLLKNIKNYKELTYGE